MATGVTAVATTSTAGRASDQGWKTTAQGMITLTLHGAIQDDGLVRGTFVTTEADKRKSHVESGQFVLKPLNAQQGGTGRTATRPESKSEGGDKPQPE